MEIFDVEAEALWQGLEAANAHPLAGSMDALLACVDSKAVATSTYSTSYSMHASSSASTLHHYQRLLERWGSWQSGYRALPPGMAKVIWVPSHAEIAGNEDVDREAKAGASKPIADHRSRPGLRILPRVTGTRETATR